MNIRLIAALTVAILFAHAVLIHLLLKTSALQEEIAKPEKEAAEETTSETALPVLPEKPAESPSVPPQPSPAPAEPPVSPVPSAVSVPEPLPPVSSGTAPESPVLPDVPSPRKFVWKPLNYSNAVRGKLPGVRGADAASGGMLVNLTNRKVLWAKQSNSIFPIASMSKLMTILVAYEAVLRQDRYPQGLNTMVPVTKDVVNIPPSKVNLMVGESFPIGDLMAAAAVKSANDAAWLIAQFIGRGKVEPFVAAMNEKAARLGMKNTKFFNPNGLPGAVKKQDNCSTAEDMVRLCEAYMQYPQLVQWSSTRVMDFRTPGDKQFMKLFNHNRLLPGAKYSTPGVNGLKTGFTNRARYCVAVTCTRQGQTLLAIITGYPDQNGRDVFVRALLDWGFRRSGVTVKNKSGK